MSKFSVWTCSSPPFLDMDKCFRDGLHLAVGLWDSTALFLILHSILAHILLWRTTNASRRSRKVKPEVTLPQRVAAGHLCPCMAGMIQVNPGFVYPFHPYSPWGKVEKQVYAWAQQLHFHLAGTDMKDDPSLPVPGKFAKM